MILLMSVHWPYTRVPRRFSNLLRRHQLRRNLYTSTKQILQHQRLQVFNSLSGRIEPLPCGKTWNGGKEYSSIGIQPACYICGPTVYAPAHLGHARTYVWMDIFRRVWESTSLEHVRPLFCVNITDVDDKILAAAAEQNIPPLDLARQYEKEFWRDWDALNCLRPHVVTRVTECVDNSIIPYIQQLLKSGLAYVVHNDGVYFDVAAFERQTKCTYGKLAPATQRTDFSTQVSTETTLEESVVKRNARDFALWKQRKEGELMYWSAPWGGEGRPGWHIECSAMIEHIQRDRYNDQVQFMVHAGGTDLQFPHHTNEIAQAEAFRSCSHDTCSESEWIPHWMHTGHLHIDGRKMSKSLKNFITIEEMLKSDQNDALFSSPADDFRWWCLSSPYRTTATFGDERLRQARKMRERVVRLLVKAEEQLKISEPRACVDLRFAAQKVSDDLQHDILRAEARGKEAMILSDLDGPGYISAIMSVHDRIDQGLRDSANNLSQESLIVAVSTLRGMLSFVGFSEKTYDAGILVNSPTESLVNIPSVLDSLLDFRAKIRERALQEVKKGGNAGSSLAHDVLAQCDHFRDTALPSLGIEVLDSKHESDQEGSWRFCMPHARENVLEGTRKKSTAPCPQEFVAVEDFFRNGQYEGQFGKFDKTGFPLSHADGSELSNRLQKKLTKKREKHTKRLQEASKKSN